MPETRESNHNTLHLSDVLYGCVSSPSYLPPLEIILSSGEEALLQNGSFSVGQNPSLYLFLVATSPAFEFRWRTGERWLQLFSIGTGQKKARKRFKGPTDVNILSLVVNLIDIQIEGANELNRLLLDKIASTEAPDGEPERVPFSRQRYNVHLDAGTMLALGLNDLGDIEDLAAKTIDERLRSLSRIGRRAIEQVQDEDFLRTFDVRRPLKGGVDVSSVAS